MFCRPDCKAWCARRGLPAKMLVRFGRPHLTNRDLGLLATQSLAGTRYPTDDLAEVHHTGWGKEPCHLRLASWVEGGVLQGADC